MRVVSLLPSATEIAYAVGREPVAVSHECDHSPAAEERPVAIRTRVEGGSSAEINEQVATAEAAGGVYELRLDVLRAADPDVLLTQGICDVCAVDDSVVHDAVADLGLDADVVSSHPHRLGDIVDDVRRIGAALDRGERAEELADDLEKRIDAVAEATPAGGPEVAILEWMDPIMLGGHWMPELIDLAGGRCPVAEPGARSRPREWAELREYDPDAIVIAPCGFSIEETLAHVDELTGREGWDDLTAVREGEVYVMDGHSYLNRPGPRIVDSLEALAGLLHPDKVAPPPDGVARPLSEAAVS